MKNKLRITFVALIILLTGTTAVASNEWVVKEYKGKIFWMGKEFENSPQAPFLERNGVVYIPVRTFDRENVGFTRYNSISKDIFIDPYDTLNTESSSNHYSEKQDHLLHLRMNSEKKNYRAGENLEIWSVLSNISDKQLNILHGRPLLVYYVIDEQGRKFSETRSLKAVNSTISPNNQTIRVWNGMVSYNYQRGQEEYDKENGELMFNKEVTRPLRLPKGKYTIGVWVDYSILDDLVDQKTPQTNNTPTRLETNLQITIN